MLSRQDALRRAAGRLAMISSATSPAGAGAQGARLRSAFFCPFGSLRLRIAVQARHGAPHILQARVIVDSPHHAFGDVPRESAGRRREPACESHSYGAGVRTDVEGESNRARRA
jgi:hypothetical protein